jgi:formate-dependent nitrite reductase membrane component NrfD
MTVHPVPVFLVSLAALSLAAWIGTTRFGRMRAEVTTMREEFGIIQGATLTLLGLIVGFTFSMALSRYEQRKNYEEEEANAIGTEYLRADLLPAGDAASVRTLLRAYVDQRMLFYTTRDSRQLEQVNAATAALQAEMWSAVKAPALAQPTPLSALAVAGMNDVINTQGYTQAAWSNRIPLSAWLLVVSIAMCATLLVGIGTKRSEKVPRVLLILPLVISMALFLIADIDSPRRGIIRVVPENLESLAGSLQTPD